MTVSDYNKRFIPAYNRAFSFLVNVDHALSKCDDNARMQLKCIGWDEQTKAFLNDALSIMLKKAQESYRWNMKDWWNMNNDE